MGWAEELGPVVCAGVEGTSSYGAGLARYLSRAGIEVLEVERPKRRHLRRNGKSDPKDAARAVLAGDVAGVPKSGDGRVEMIRALRADRRSTVKARSQAANQLRSLRVTAPDALRDRLRGLSTKGLVAAAVRLRPGALPQTPEEATKVALRSVAHRHGPSGAYEGAVQTVSDVTERRKHERALGASEERFRMTFEAAGVGMAHVAPDGRWLRINGKLAEIVGYTKEELLSKTFQDITHPDDLVKDLEHVRRMLVGEMRATRWRSAT